MNKDIVYCGDDLETWQFYIPIVEKSTKFFNGVFPTYFKITTVVEDIDEAESQLEKRVKNHPKISQKEFERFINTYVAHDGEAVEPIHGTFTFTTCDGKRPIVDFNSAMLSIETIKAIQKDLQAVYDWESYN